MNWGNWD